VYLFVNENRNFKKQASFATNTKTIVYLLHPQVNKLVTGKTECHLTINKQLKI